MYATRYATLIALLAALTLSTACGKKNGIDQKRAVQPGAATGTRPQQPAPSTGSQSQYAAIQGTWIESGCEPDLNQQWGVMISGDTLTYTGIDCSTGAGVDGGFSLRFTMSPAPTNGNFTSHITYYNTDGSVYFEEDVTGTSNPKALSFTGDSTTYYFSN